MIEQDLVEAYFECNGFLVRQAPISSKPLKNKKKLGILPVISVLNPRVPQNEKPMSPRLFSADIARVHSARVATLGWWNSNFSPAYLTSEVQLVKFFKQELDENRIHACFTMDTPGEDSGISDSLKIIVVPALPKDTDRLKKVYQQLENSKIQGVLTMRSILENLLRQTQPLLNYEGHEVLQTLRLVKTYGLSKDPQLEIFEDD